MPQHNRKRYCPSGFYLIFLLLNILIVCSPAFADTDQSDLAVGMKVLPLLNDKITGTAALAIIFDPANPSSVKEAQEIKSILDSGFQAPGDLKLSGVLVPVNELGRLTGSRIAILTGGLSAYYNAVSNAVAGRNILTMSTDLGCARAHKCILGIVSKPHVEIYYSREAAENAKVTFGQVFALLVTEI